MLLTCADGTPFAIESKFAEPYSNSKAKTFLKLKYLPDDRRLWTESGLPGCQTVAEALGTGQHKFEVLDVAQLLKHMLALARRFGDRWMLCCLWSEVPGSLADRHRQELADFAARIGADAGDVSALTYQELIVRMVPFVEHEDSEYIGYLRERYIGDAVGS